MTHPETSELTLADGTVLRYCLYGPSDGYPVVSQNGTPSSRWKWPTLVESMQQSKLRTLVYDRPGYGGSTRRPGRTVADAVDDVRALADAQGWDQFAVFGGSGGGPHALACAALLADRVTSCAVLSGVKPADPGTPALEEGELRSRIAEVAGEIMAGIDDGAPELPNGPGPAARDDPDAMARLRATFVDGTDGWVDDSIALARPWGFDLATITVPVGLWRGTSDVNVPSEQADYLLAHIPTAQGHVYDGGHVPGAAVYEEIYDWLSATTSPEDPSQAWLELAPDYERARTREDSLDRLVEWPAQRDLLGEVAGLSVLDLGCGNGGKLVELVRDGAAASVGVDVSGNFLSATPPGLKLIRGDLSELDSLPGLADRKFDRILFLQSFGYAKDPVRTLRAARSMLADSGFILLTRTQPIRYAVEKAEQNGTSLGEEYFSTAAFSYLSGWNGQITLTKRPYTISDLINVFSAAGLWIETATEPEMSEDAGRRYPHKQAWMNKYLGILIFKLRPR